MWRSPMLIRAVMAVPRYTTIGNTTNTVPSRPQRRQRLTYAAIRQKAAAVDPVHDAGESRHPLEHHRMVLEVEQPRVRRARRVPESVDRPDGDPARRGEQGKNRQYRH